MLKTTRSPSGLAPKRNNGGEPASGRNDGDGENFGFGVSGSDGSLNQKII